MLTEESSIAKGVRRISAVTGSLAVQAYGTGNTLYEETKVIQEQMKQFLESKTVRKEDLEYLEKEFFHGWYFSYFQY